ncbi:hypothetical protein M0805_004799 [Coniferiporia weirii]|nr:hypothetical protein M0805_004799 [Coniferiporia weirii]
MANAEQIFNSCTLDLVVPDNILQLPALDGSVTADDWLQLAQDSGCRTKAFFDEKLEFYLTVRFQHEDQSPNLLSPDNRSPPTLLLSFLNHLQISLEATYIPSAPQEVSHNGRLPMPPARTSSAALTPKTPNPMPLTNELDKKYMFAEGTPLKSFVWGEDLAEEGDSFRLLQSTSEMCWVAIYKLTLSVVYVKTNFNNPLLCLTTSITLRDRPSPPTPQRQTLNNLIKEAGPLPSLVNSPPLKDVSTLEQPCLEHAGSPEYGLLEEVNLLDGLSTGPVSSDKLYLPTTRLGASARRAYALPPISPGLPRVPAPSPSRTLPILRRSFRKTLGTASGFHVRMRPVMVPQIYLPGGADDEQETSGEESTVVLSVEIENPGDSEAGFSVEVVDVSIRGEDAKIRLIPWGEKGFADLTKVLPILIRPKEQYYLLYAITFLRSPESDLPRTTEQESQEMYDKVVSIHIAGRPFTIPVRDLASVEGPDQLSYHTSPFLSRWNCRLDLDPRRRAPMRPPEISLDAGPTALPIPASPFPAASPRTQQAQNQASALTNVQMNTMVSSKRHTFAGVTSPFVPTSQRPMSLTTSPSGTLSPGVTSPLGKIGRKSWMTGTPFSIQVPLSPPLPPLPGTSHRQSQNPPPTASTSAFPFPVIPPTPAYPSYGNQPLTPRPGSVVPSFGQVGRVGQGLDARRERLALPGVPTTPAPRLPTMPPLSSRDVGYTDPGAKDFVVSQSIYPLDEFSLEIFVFNQSPYIRTLEATFADNRRRRDEKRGPYFPSTSANKWKPAPPAFMPLESGIRIGPLGPSTCQSVTMRFLALTPGVHTIDDLVLTDLDSGESIRLRSVMDFAIIRN